MMENALIYARFSGCSLRVQSVQLQNAKTVRWFHFRAEHLLPLNSLCCLSIALIY